MKWLGWGILLALWLSTGPVLAQTDGGDIMDASITADVRTVLKMDETSGQAYAPKVTLTGKEWQNLFESMFRSFIAQVRTFEEKHFTDYPWPEETELDLGPILNPSGREAPSVAPTGGSRGVQTPRPADPSASGTGRLPAADPVQTNTKSKPVQGGKP